MLAASIKNAINVNLDDVDSKSCGLQVVAYLYCVEKAAKGRSGVVKKHSGKPKPRQSTFDLMDAEDSKTNSGVQAKRKAPLVTECKEAAQVSTYQLFLCLHACLPMLAHASHGAVADAANAC